MMIINQIDQLKNAYAEMIVEGMDMNSLITLAVESIEQNLKDYDMGPGRSDCGSSLLLQGLQHEAVYA